MARVEVLWKLLGSHMAGACAGLGSALTVDINMWPVHGMMAS